MVETTSSPNIELVHSDSRGEIYSITLPGDKELVLLHSLPGSLRGGHAHDCDEIIILLTGAIHYQKHDPNGVPWEEDMKAGQTSFVPRNRFHVGQFLEDSWLLEWKLTKDKHSWKNIDWPAYREKVVANVRH